MIKLICFDLDGVLVTSKETHYKSLNLALKEVDEKYVISWDEHLKKYDGLPTNRKLKMLTADKKLPVEFYEQIWKRKQELTFDIINTDVKVNYELRSLFDKLSRQNIKIHCCSNSIRKTIALYLTRLGIIEYFDHIVSNESITNPKPHPEMYLSSMVKEHTSPKETLIVEDSHVGINAALSSGANLLRVNNPSDVTEKNIFDAIIKYDNTKHNIKWQGEKMNIIIPMAGAGSRFAVAGYTFPKPLIEVRGKPMIQTVVDNINIQATYTYIVRKEHYEKYNLQYLLNIITPNCNVVQVDSLTEGAACTTLLAEKFIDNEQPLLIANSDQFIEWDSSEFMYAMNAGNIDGGILTFDNTHPKWSYVKIDEENYVTELAEKKVISNNATVGIYYWSKGSDYVKYAKQMIEKNIRVNNEFYVAPVYNESLLDNAKIKIFNIDKMWGIGTPEDLNYFLENYNGPV
jgi:HAD superfamily hydrolase (TIGR01509 family)